METKVSTLMTRKEFIKLTDTFEKVSFSDFLISTTPRMNKTGNPYFTGLEKVTKSRILIGMEYEKRRQKTDPTFVVSVNRVFDVHVNDYIGYNTKFNRYYLKYEWFDQVPPKSEYFHNGNPIDKKLFESWLIVSSGSPLNYQVVNLDNLMEISINGNRYKLTD